MIELRITPTGKSYSPSDTWRHLSERDEVHHFDTKSEALAYLRERYGKAKRNPMYQDRKDGTTVKIGWVIGFRNTDMSHYPPERWLQQDWVSIMEVKCNPIRI